MSKEKLNDLTEAERVEIQERMAAVVAALPPTLVDRVSLNRAVASRKRLQA